MGLRIPLWHAVNVFRMAALVYAALLNIPKYSHYEHPAGSWIIIGVMSLWTVVAYWAYSSSRRRGVVLLCIDFSVAALCLFVSRWVVCAEGVPEGDKSLPTAWVCASVLAWSVYSGRRGGGIAAVFMGVVDITVRSAITPETMNGAILMVLAAVVVGHGAQLSAETARKLEEAAEREASIRERERLARGIHDSVLQVLAFVQRRGREIGGEAAELGILAGQQEATLRALIAQGENRSSTNLVDLCQALGVLVDDPSITISVPAAPVWLAASVVTEVKAAMKCAVDNVRTHAGDTARAWIFIEDEFSTVTVTIRDDGVGIPDGRLAEAEVEGRLGISQSIRGRIQDLGGDVRITSAVGEGTEVECRIPRHFSMASK